MNGFKEIPKKLLKKIYIKIGSWHHAKGSMPTRFTRIPAANFMEGIYEEK